MYITYVKRRISKIDFRGCLQSQQQTPWSKSSSFSVADIHLSLTEAPNSPYGHLWLSTVDLWPGAYINHPTSLIPAMYMSMTSIDSTLLDFSCILYLYNTITLYGLPPSRSILLSDHNLNYHNRFALMFNSITIISFIRTHYTSLLNCCYV